jgi:hypothetical protein
VYNNTLATLKRQIQQAENPMPAAVISTEAGSVDNAILLDYLASEVALEEPEVGSTEPNISTVNNSTDNQLHFGKPGGNGDYEDECDESDMRDAFTTASWGRRPATKLERFALGTSDVEGYEGKNGDNADANEDEEASQANDESTHNMDD